MSDLVGKRARQGADAASGCLRSMRSIVFESIDYTLVEEDGRAGLELDLRRKSWGPNYVRVGLNLEDDFEGNSRYNAALRFIVTELNTLGGEWLTDLQIGENPKVFTEFYQPLSLASRYFIAPQFDFEERSIFELQGGDRIAEYRVRSVTGGIDFGRELSNWGEVRVGLAAGHGPLARADRRSDAADRRIRSRRLLCALLLRQARQHLLPAPRPAVRVRMARRAREHRRRQDFDAFVSSGWSRALSTATRSIFWADAGTTIDAAPTPENFFSLGGFLNLSGLPPGSLSGPHYGIARLHVLPPDRARRLGRARSAGVRGRLARGRQYLADREDVSFGDLRKDGERVLRRRYAARPGLSRDRLRRRRRQARSICSSGGRSSKACRLHI